MPNASSPAVVSKFVEPETKHELQKEFKAVQS